MVPVKILRTLLPSSKSCWLTFSTVLSKTIAMKGVSSTEGVAQCIRHHGIKHTQIHLQFRSRKTCYFLVPGGNQLFRFPKQLNCGWNSSFEQFELECNWLTWTKKFNTFWMQSDEGHDRLLFLSGAFLMMNMKHNRTVLYHYWYASGGDNWALRRHLCVNSCYQRGTGVWRSDGVQSDNWTDPSIIK